MQFWYYNFEIILCLKCNKIGNNKYRNFECEVWKALKYFAICVIRLNFRKIKYSLVRLVLWQMWAGKCGKIVVGFSKKSKFEGENVDGN